MKEILQNIYSHLITLDLRLEEVESNHKEEPNLGNLNNFTSLLKDLQMKTENLTSR